ncbi:MAG TPA: hypothetical protein VNA25_18160, partial [Phycisphaerae bacterium]|nr:hypothetical protein [Phycisphaerae bacterium]
SQPPGRMPGAGNAADGRSTEALLVQIRMLSIEVPLGAASGSEDIWSYLDEESVRGSELANLAHNGFRVGVARRDSWRHLERIFIRLTGRRARGAVMSGLPGNPIQVVLKRRQPAQTIFTFYEDKTISGRDLPPGDNVLTILCALNAGEPNEVVVIGRPQVRATHQKTEIIDDRSGFLWVSRPKMYDFGPLAFQVSVPNDDLIVVGPGAAARRPTSVARHFLIKEKEGIRFETVLVLIPRVVRASARSAPAGSPGSAGRS